MVIIVSLNKSNMNHQKGNTSVIVSFIIVVGIIILIVYALTHKNTEVTSENTIGDNTETTESITNNNTEVKDQTATSTKPMDSNQPTKLRGLPNFTPIEHLAIVQK